MPAYASLTRAERRTYLDAVADGASRVVSLRILDLDHGLQGEIEGALVGGQVDVSKVARRDAGEQTTRVCELHVVDVRRAITWDPDSPSRLALWPSRMVQVVDGYDVPGLGVVTHETFTGPVVGYSRAGALVKPRCVGKEWLAQRELGQNKRWAKGTPVVEVMRELMEMVGETRFDIPDIKAKLHKRLMVRAVQDVWPLVQRLARSENLHAYYPGSGVFTVRRLPGNPSMLWTTGEGGLVTGDLEVSFAVPEDFANDTIVTGRRRRAKTGTAKRRKNRRIRGRWRPNSGHPLAPRELERGGVPGVFRTRIRNPKVKTDAQADQIAERRGKDAIRMVSDATFDHYPGIPFDEGDLHQVVSDDHGKVTFRVHEFSIPYDMGGETTQTLNKLRRKRAARK